MSGKPNGFMLFSRQILAEERRRGQRFSFSDAVDRARKLWQELTEQQKLEWKEKAKKEVGWTKTRKAKGNWPQPQVRSEPRPVKLNKSFVAELQLRQRKQYYYLPDEKSLYARIRSLDLGDIQNFITFNVDNNNRLQWLMEQEFVFVAAIPYLETSEHRFLPAELVLARYKVRHGLHSLLHLLLAPAVEEENLDAHYMKALAKHRDHPRKGHGIWTDRGVSLERDYVTAYKRIWAIISKHRFVFCNTERYNLVRGCLNWLRTKYMSTKQIKEDKMEKEPPLVAVEELLTVLCRFPWGTASTGQAPTVDEIEKALQPSGAEENGSQASCKFHQEIGNKNCAVRLARTSLWGGSLLLAKHLGFDVAPLSQLPEAPPQQELSLAQSQPLASGSSVPEGRRKRVSFKIDEEPPSNFGLPSLDEMPTTLPESVERERQEQSVEEGGAGRQLAEVAAGWWQLETASVVPVDEQTPADASKLTPGVGKGSTKRLPTIPTGLMGRVNQVLNGKMDGKKSK